MFGVPPQHTVTETCPCGAKLVLTSHQSMLIAYRLEDFHNAHAVCRARASRETDLTKEAE